MGQNGHGTSNRHLLIMLLCCLVPIGIFLAISVFNVPLGTIGFFAIILLCPLLHFLLMGKMRHNGEDQHKFIIENESDSIAGEDYK